IRRLLSNEGTEREENDYPNRASRGRGRVFGMTRHSMDDSGPPTKRRAVGGAFSRLGPVPVRRRDREDSPYEEELPNKLSVHSSVVSTSRESKNRKEIMQEQTKDKEGMQRNRRMFGLLLGTLNKFRTESKTMESKEYQRKRIEEKVEENAEKEKRKFKQETKLLIEEMHLEQSKISRLQQKMEMVQEHAERAGEVKKLKNFIVTKTQPRIFWKPLHMSAALENKLKESKKFVDGMLQESNDRLEKEIKELMERENKREERIKMRLREDGLLEDGDGKGEVGEDEGHNNESMGESGRVVEVKEEIDQPNPVAERLGQDHEEERLDAEMDDLGDSRKKSRRTVVVEREVSSDSESEMEQEHHESEKSDVDKDHAGSDKETEGNTSGIQPGLDEPAAGKKGGANEDLSADGHRDDKEPGSSASESESSDSERELARERQRHKDKEEQRNKDREEQKNKDKEEWRNKDKEEQRNKDREEQRNKDKEEQRNKDKEEQRNKDKEEQRNKDKEEQRNKDRNHKESRRDRKRDKKEDSEERNTERHRRSEDKRHSKRDSGDKGKRDSGDKGRSRRESHEEKRDKDRRRDSHDGGKKSSSHRTKDRKRYSDSEESDVEVKQEKDVGKNKDTSQSESSNRDRDTVQRRPKVLDDAEVEID
ncbi:unnamed protein product, partial [Candidula unifasciata]